MPITDEQRADIIATMERIQLRAFGCADEDNRRFALGLPPLGDINAEIDEAQAELTALRKRLTASGEA